MTFILGLTGSIGMGKSTTAAMFREEGVPVYDADAAVHKLYNGRAIPLIEEHFPAAIRQGRIDRQLLAQQVLNNAEALKKLESLIHPLVREEEQDFLKKNPAPLVVLDIPLLFETGADKRCDAVLVVTARPECQKKRVLARADMNEEKFQAILSRQMPDEEKRQRARFIVETDHGFDVARRQVKDILRTLAAGF